MTNNITIDDLAALIAEEMQNYTEEVTEITKKAVDKTAQAVNEEIKNHITFNEPTGKYVKSFRLKTVQDTKDGKIVVWSAGQYRLTHLLEKGHVTRDGGRTRAYPHIKYGEELAQKILEQKIAEGVAKQ